MKSLLGRFKEIYENGTDFKVSWSKLGKDGNLTVGIVDKEGYERFWLHVVEHNGQIEWY
jgi:hypothetical protein